MDSVLSGNTYIIRRHNMGNILRKQNKPIGFTTVTADQIPYGSGSVKDALDGLTENVDNLNISYTVNNLTMLNTVTYILNNIPTDSVVMGTVNGTVVGKVNFIASVYPSRLYGWVQLINYSSSVGILLGQRNNGSDTVKQVTLTSY